MVIFLNMALGFDETSQIYNSEDADKITFLLT
jgi:hypothetical protein